MLPPKQFTLVCALVVEVSALAGCVMVTFCAAVQPLASVTVQVHVPAGRLFAAAPFCAGAVFQA